MKQLLIILAIACTACGGKEQKAKETPQQSIANTEKDFKVITDQLEPDTIKGSIKAKATGSIGNATVTINYYSPAVRGRIIWGGLVPNDQVWVTGAHHSTYVEFDREVKIGEKTIAAGKYGLFTIPSKDQWIIILNTNWDQHLADNYKANEDVVRVGVTPKASGQQERLQYTVKEISDSQGMIVIRWEGITVELPLSLQL